MADLATMFPDAKGLKTYKGALKRVADIAERMEEKFLYTVITKADGTFLPVAILSEKNEWMAGPFAGSGICVTRA